MTFYVSDTTPDTWFKMKFTNDRLAAVDMYLTDNAIVNVKVSGAVTYGVMESLYGPSPSTISFESKVEYDAFVEWFNTTQHEVLADSIYVAKGSDE